MPTYEFTCPQGHDFDKFFRSMASAPTVVPCPVCGEPADRQMSAGAGLVFHGSGFYITDYGKDGKKDQKDQKAASRRATESGEPKDSSAGEAKTGSSAESGSSESKGDSSSTSAESKSAGESAPASPKPAETAAKPSPAPKASE